MGYGIAGSDSVNPEIAISGMLSKNVRCWWDIQDRGFLVEELDQWIKEPVSAG